MDIELTAYLVERVDISTPTEKTTCPHCLYQGPDSPSELLQES